MPDIKELQSQIAKLTTDAKTLYSEMEKDESKRTAENREKLDRYIEDGKSLKEDLRRAQDLGDLEAFTKEPAGQPKAIENPGIEGKARGERPVSWGNAFTNSEEYKHAAQGGFRTPNVSPVQVKAIYESTEATGGAAVFSQRVQEIYDRAPLAPTTLLDIMNVAPTNSSSIDFVVVTGFTNNAAEVAEYTGGNFGAKPESDLTFDLENAPVQTIAHWVAASRNILSDAPRLRNTIDNKLIQGLRRRLEGQVIAGNGTSPNLRGIRNTTGVQTRSGAAGSGSARFVTGDTRLDTIRRAITDVELAFGQADAIVLPPAEAEALELQKDDNKNYMNVYDPVAQRVWRVRVVVNQALATNRAIVGDFSQGATLYLREDAVVRVSESHSDFFIRNAIVILAELRAALAVTDPELFVDITALA